MSQTQRDIQVMLAAAGISPLKRFGQNFLIDANLMRKLVEAAGITAHDVVLEVGPGTGALTDHLIERAGHVICVEVDRGMQAICLARFGNRGNFTLISGDVLAGKSQISTAVLHAIAHQHALLRGRAMLVSNLPYQVATPLVIELMIGQMIISPLCFTVQAEVGDRLVSPPGSKTYGPISILAQLYGKLSRIARVPPGAFWPVPGVDSVMLRWDRLADFGLSLEDQQALERVVHHCFQYRRKTMHSSLRMLLKPDSLTALEKHLGWDFTIRPEQIHPTQWTELANAFRKAIDKSDPA